MDFYVNLHVMFSVSLFCWRSCFSNGLSKIGCWRQNSAVENKYKVRHGVTLAVKDVSVLLCLTFGKEYLGNLIWTNSLRR